MPKFDFVASGMVSSLHRGQGAAKIHRCSTLALTTRQPAAR
ncbi:MAG: hypothetical protein ACLQNV_20310 [Steroidobacteraceae bacterium]|jgi:hypothetical protein